MNRNKIRGLRFYIIDEDTLERIPKRPPHPMRPWHTGGGDVSVCESCLLAELDEEEVQEHLRSGKAKLDKDRHAACTHCGAEKA